jgi:hypothetical protein
MLLLLAEMMGQHNIIFVRSSAHHTCGFLTAKLICAVGCFWTVLSLRIASAAGMYFVSSVLLMRMSVPLQYRTIITRVLGEIKFHFYHAYFDIVFLISALVTMMCFFLSRQSTARNKINDD